MRPVFVIEGLELAQHIQKVALVPDQGSVQQLAPAGLDLVWIHRSMMEFIRGIRTPHLMIRTPASVMPLWHSARDTDPRDRIIHPALDLHGEYWALTTSQ